MLSRSVRCLVESHPTTDLSVVVDVFVDFLSEDEVPAVEAVLAPVGDDVAGIPRAVLPRWRQQERAPSAVDARDLRVGLDHTFSIATDRRSVTCRRARRGGRGAGGAG